MHKKKTVGKSLGTGLGAGLWQATTCFLLSLGLVSVIGLTPTDAWATSKNQPENQLENQTEKYTTQYQYKAKKYKAEGHYLLMLRARTKLGEGLFDLDDSVPGPETRVEKFKRRYGYTILRLSARGYIYGYLHDFDPERKVWRYYYYDQNGDGKMEWEFHDIPSHELPMVPQWIKLGQPSRSYFLGCDNDGDPACDMEATKAGKEPTHFSDKLKPEDTQATPLPLPPNAEPKLKPNEAEGPTDTIKPAQPTSPAPSRPGLFARIARPG